MVAPTPWTPPLGAVEPGRPCDPRLTTNDGPSAPAGQWPRRARHPCPPIPRTRKAGSLPSCRPPSRPCTISTSLLWMRRRHRPLLSTSRSNHISSAPPPAVRATTAEVRLELDEEALADRGSHPPAQRRLSWAESAFHSGVRGHSHESRPPDSIDLPAQTFRPWSSQPIHRPELMPDGALGEPARTSAPRGRLLKHYPRSQNLTPEPLLARRSRSAESRTELERARPGCRDGSQDDSAAAATPQPSGRPRAACCACQQGVGRRARRQTEPTGRLTPTGPNRPTRRMDETDPGPPPPPRREKER